MGELKLKQGQRGAVILLDDEEIAPDKLVSLGTFNETGGALQPSGSGVLMVNKQNPAAFQTIQAAIDVALAVTGVWPDYDRVIEIAPGTYTEDLQIDLVDDRTLTLRGIEQIYGVYLSGDIEYNSVDSSHLIVDRIYSDGAITGTKTGVGTHSRLSLLGSAIDGAVTLTGACDVTIDGMGPESTPCRGYTGAVTTGGNVSCRDASMTSGITAADVSLHACDLGGTITTAGTAIPMTDCGVTGATGFVFSAAAGVVITDDYTLSSLLYNASTVTNGVWSKATFLPSGAATIATGVLPANAFFSQWAVIGEGGANDDLVTVSGTVAGQLLVLRASSDTVTITVKNGTGNIFLAGSDFALDNLKDMLTLISDGTNLYELARANNGA